MEVGASFSTGHIAIYHNFRYTHTQNVNPELSQDNVVIVNNLHTADQKMMSINEYTDRRMQPVIDAYNAKQKGKTAGSRSRTLIISAAKGKITSGI